MNYDPENWRTRTGRMGARERERALSAITALDQTHLREWGGGLG